MSLTLEVMISEKKLNATLTILIPNGYKIIIFLAPITNEWLKVPEQLLLMVCPIFLVLYHNKPGLSLNLEIVHIAPCILSPELKVAHLFCRPQV